MGRVMICEVLNVASDFNSAREMYRFVPDCFRSLAACRFSKTGPKVSIHSNIVSK